MVDHVCVSEELADGVVHDSAPLDVVSIHRGGFQGTQNTEPCVCVFEGADDELIDAAPSFHVVEQSRQFLLLGCKCVCHVFTC